MHIKVNKSVERMAAGGHCSHIRLHEAAAIAHFHRSMKTAAVVFLALFYLAEVAYATLGNGWPTQVVISPSGRYSAFLKHFTNPALTIRTNNSDLRSFKFSEFQIPEPSEHSLGSTAGFLWYRDCIAFFDKSERYLVIRVKWGPNVVIDLGKMAVIPEVPIDLRTEIERTLKERVLALLFSEDAWERENGAGYARDMRMEEAIPRLKELTADKQQRDEKHDAGPGVKAFFVRKAAIDALKKMNIPVASIVLEEPKQ